MILDSITAETNSLSAGSYLISAGYPSPNVQHVLTRVLENVLHHFEDHREAIATAPVRDDILDVRHFGSTPAVQLLRGVEERITYDDLRELIGVFKDGVAARRLGA